jgi:hypothetical protein
MKTTSKVISSKDITGLAVEASIVLCAVFSFGTLTSESKIEAKALVRKRNRTRSIGARGSLFHFCLDTNRASIEDRGGVTKLGDSINIFVSIIEMLVTNMVQTLMPEETFSRDMEFVNLQFG